LINAPPVFQRLRVLRRYSVESSPLLIATHKAKYFQTESGLSLGPGPFVVALENASDARAHVVGKPTKEFFQMVIDDFTAEELPIPANIEHGDGSPKTIGLGTMSTSCPPTFRGRIVFLEYSLNTSSKMEGCQLSI
jgi:hypothetical protein